MTMKPLGQPIAVGRTAEVYAWGDGTILKLYYAWCPAHWVEQEAHISQVVTRAGVPAPAVLDRVTLDNRPGIIYERVDGPDMLMAMQKQPLRLATQARVLADLHVAMHRCLAADLPPQRDGLTWAIQNAKALSEDVRRSALAKLAQLPDGQRLCHGDFHPGNVILTSKGPIVIDWMTARQGHPATDVARTRLLLTVGTPPQGGLIRLVILLGRSLYVRAYLRAYESQAPGVVALSEAFMPIQAAARLSEEIPTETAKLLKMIG